MLFQKAALFPLAADIMQMQKDTGFTGIFVTHDMEEARQVASRIVEMREGRLEAIQAPAGSL